MSKLQEVQVLFPDNTQAEISEKDIREGFSLDFEEIEEKTLLRNADGDAGFLYDVVANERGQLGYISQGNKEGAIAPVLNFSSVNVLTFDGGFKKCGRLLRIGGKIRAAKWGALERVKVGEILGLKWEWDAVRVRDFFYVDGERWDCEVSIDGTGIFVKKLFSGILMSGEWEVMWDIHLI